MNIKDLCYNPNISVQLAVTDLDVFVHTIGEMKPTRKQKDHERYMRNREERLKHQESIMQSTVNTSKSIIVKSMQKQ